MTKKKKESFIKLLKEHKEDHPHKKGTRSTIVDCCDFLLTMLGEKI